MIIISEWLANPDGNDAPNEWVEICNTSDSIADISGWRLTADGKKFYALDGAIGAGGRLILRRIETKITLKNSDGRLALYDASGRLADQVSFFGSAPEGESANRTADGNIFFGKPTPGAANEAPPAAELAHLDCGERYPLGAPLNPTMSVAPRFAGYLLGTALALVASLMFILKAHEDLSNIFFQRDQDAGRCPRGKIPDRAPKEAG